MRHYCTYFDRHYLVQGIVLYRSLRLSSREPFILWVLCFDEETFDVLSRLSLGDLRPVALSALEQVDTALLAAKSNRSRVEYYFTCSPAWPLYLLTHGQGIDATTYLDADIMFFSDPGPIHAEMGGASVFIVGHRFPEVLRHKEVYGIYNVSLLSFRNDARGLECLEWWRARCLEWCYDRVEEGRFADQKYLDDWPQRFPGVAVLQHPGAGLAPWNWVNHDIRATGDGTTVDGQPLVCYHYQGFKVLGRFLYDLGLKAYGRMPGRLRRLIYLPYIRAIVEAEAWLRGTIPGVRIEYPRVRTKSYGSGEFIKRLRRRDISIVFH